MAGWVVSYHPPDWLPLVGAEPPGWDGWYPWRALEAGRLHGIARREWLRENRPDLSFGELRRMARMTVVDPVARLPRGVSDVVRRGTHTKGGR